MDSAPAQLAIQKKLNEAFFETQLKNPAFSLRAFARRLELSPSAVSEILKGKRRISKKLANRVVKNLCLGPDEALSLLELFPERSSRKEMSGNYSSPYIALGIDEFHLISAWYHFAIRALARTKGFQSDPEWIGERLNIRPAEAKDAIERLERIGLLKTDPSGRLVAAEGDYATPDGTSDAGIRKSHAGNIELARNSLENDDPQIRDFTSTTMAIDASKIPVAKKMIREFHDKLAAYLEAGPRTEVYKLCVQLIPLSKGKRGSDV